MLISNWMTHDPIAVSPTTSLSKCQKLMKTNSFHRLPVIDENRKVVGIISDRDVKSASPSKATSLEIHEVQYLLAEVKAKDIMTPKPVTVKSTDTVATAALLMLDKKIGGLPVVDDDGVLIGIITDQDIFKVFVTISGARIDGIDVTVEAPNTPGSLGPIFRHDFLSRQRPAPHLLPSAYTGKRAGGTHPARRSCRQGQSHRMVRDPGGEGLRLPSDF